MIESPHPEPRPVDHLVLPTARLDLARSRLSRMGFTVAPRGVHPFGTENACVYFADGTFLEPLAVRDEGEAFEASGRGNVFVARDAAFRYRRGEEGFSAVVFGTNDAEADQAEFVSQGCSAGPLLEFSRAFVDAGGRSGTASFRLAFAADPRAPDVFFFTCQRLNLPELGRTDLEKHANGATGIRAVVLVAPKSADFDPILRLVTRAAFQTPGDRGRVLSTANASIELMNNDELRRLCGPLSSADRGLEARGIVFAVPDLEATRSLLTANGMECEKSLGRLIVLPAPGQGACFAFEEAL